MDIIFQAHNSNFQALFKGNCQFSRQIEKSSTFQDRSQIQALFKVCGNHVNASSGMQKTSRFGQLCACLMSWNAHHRPCQEISTQRIFQPCFIKIWKIFLKLSHGQTRSCWRTDKCRWWEYPFGLRGTKLYYTTHQSFSTSHQHNH